MRIVVHEAEYHINSTHISLLLLLILTLHFNLNDIFIIYAFVGQHMRRILFPFHSQLPDCLPLMLLDYPSCRNCSVYALVVKVLLFLFCRMRNALHFPHNPLLCALTSL